MGEPVSMNSEQDTTDRAFVLGLDGVPWYLIEQWADEGSLPNFARLIDEGTAGSLQSSTPANTPVAWPAIATGRWADGHGIYEFYKLNADRSKRGFNRTDLRAPALWDVLTPSVVGNVPMTYPPASIDGKMVSGMMTPSIDSEYTHPPELADEIDERIDGYRIELDWSEYKDNKSQLVDNIDSLVKTRRELLHLLMKTDDWRLFFFVFTAPDRLQHLVWEDKEVLALYQRLDQILGEVIEFCTENGSNLFVVSDHGFGPVSTSIHVNRVLANHGHLTERTHSSGQSLLSSLGIDRSQVLGTAKSIGIDVDQIVRGLPREIVDSVARQIPGDHAVYDVDPTQTEAFLHGTGSIYINDSRRFNAGVVSPSDVSQVKSAVIDTLRNLSAPDSNEPVLDVFDGDDLLPNDDDSPDILIEPREGYTTSTRLPPEEFSKETVVTASHRPEGLFMAWGPSIRDGDSPDDPSLVDIAPTVLHSVGEPIIAPTDGRVLSEIFEPGSLPDERAHRTQRYHVNQQSKNMTEDFDSVERRLNGLGYIN